MGWIRCVHWQKFPSEFVAWTFALIAPVLPISHRVSCNNETIENAPKHYKTYQFMNFASNGVDIRVHYEKLWCDFVARTSSLIAPVQPILQRVPCSNETLPNAPKHYEMFQNMSLVPMGWIGCARWKKFWCNFMAQTCALIAQVQPVLHRASCSNKTLPNALKHYKMIQNMSLGPMGWIECVLCDKFRCDFMAQTCALIAPIQPVLHRV